MAPKLISVESVSGSREGGVDTFNADETLLNVGGGVTRSLLRGDGVLASRVREDREEWALDVRVDSAGDEDKEGDEGEGEGEHEDE